MRIFDDPITLSQAAKIVGESRENFRWYVLRGETPDYVKIGGIYLFSQKAIKEWVKPLKTMGRPYKDKRKSKRAYKD